MLGLIGKTISHYTILEQIGQGGMSSVFSAVDLRDQRVVAVKVLSPFIAHEARFKARFDREIKLLVRLQHPNIMPILDHGEAEGLAFIIMPYIGTGTLGIVCSRVRSIRRSARASCSNWLRRWRPLTPPESFTAM